MTPTDVSAELARRMPGRSNVLPMIRKGSRVAVSYRGVTATGTIKSSYGSVADAIADVVLDGTGAVISVTWATLEIVNPPGKGETP